MPLEISAPAQEVLTDEEPKEKFPSGWKALKPYLRIVPQPKG